MKRPSAIGKELKKFREAAGITQSQLADVLGTNKTYISDLEAEKVTSVGEEFENLVRQVISGKLVPASIKEISNNVEERIRLSQARQLLENFNAVFATLLSAGNGSKIFIVSSRDVLALGTPLKVVEFCESLAKTTDTQWTFITPREREGAVTRGWERELVAMEKSASSVVEDMKVRLAEAKELGFVSADQLAVCEKVLDTQLKRVFGSSNYFFNSIVSFIYIIYPKSVPSDVVEDKSDAWIQIPFDSLDMKPVMIQLNRREVAWLDGWISASMVHPRKT